MGMKLKTLTKVIEQIAPLDIQETWDNSGIQLALNTGPVKRVLVCLDITDEVIDEAQKHKADLIITHHPLIFSGMKSIDYRTASGAYITRLMELGISVYSSHTPFDKIQGGNNDYIAELLGLEHTKNLLIGTEEEPISRIGIFSKTQTLSQTVQMVKERLKLHSVGVVGSPEASIKTVAICTGAGSDFLEAAAKNGCQLFLTGDVGYHDAQKAKELGVCVIDAGHYGTEKFFADNFSKKLQEKVNGEIAVFPSEIDIDPFNK